MVDLSKAIRMTVDSGKVRFGTRDANKAALSGNAKLIVVARLAPAEIVETLRHYTALSDVPLAEYAGTPVELGGVCGKPFPVCALTISQAGNSNIVDLVKKGEAAVVKEAELEVDEDEKKKKKPKATEGYASEGDERPKRKPRRDYNRETQLGDFAEKKEEGEGSEGGDNAGEGESGSSEAGSEASGEAKPASEESVEEKKEE